jgi:phage terminase large subunit-like protein
LTTSSSVERRVGLPPTLASAPSSGEELAPDVQDEIRQVLAWADLILDDWQESFLFDSLRAGYDGKWAAFEVAGVVPRQNGKGAIMEARQLIGMFVFGERLQVHTAHEFKTCSEHFLRVKNLIEGSRPLLEQVRIIRTGAGEQGIELHTGERLRFLARSRSSIRGFSADSIYFDEAFELPVATIGSVLPALSARPKPQAWYMSSAPHYTSEFLHSVLKRAESDDPGDLFLRAWENDQDTSPDDMDAVRLVNPALGFRIDESFVESERRTLCGTPEGVSEFKRERLGIREGGDGSAGVIPRAKWDELKIPVPPRVGSVAYGLAVAPDAAWSSVGSAGRLPGGELYVDSVRFGEGTTWIVEYLADLYKRKKAPIRVDPSGSEGAFIRPLREAGVEVVEVVGREYQQACGELLAAVEGGRIRHIDQKALNIAVSAAGRRDVGKEGGWVWVRPGAIDISPLKAATLALSGVELKRKPKIHVWNGNGKGESK